MNKDLLEGFYYFFSTAWGLWGVIVCSLLLGLLIATRFFVWFRLHRPVLKKFEAIPKSQYVPFINVEKMAQCWLVVLSTWLGYWWWGVLGLVGFGIGAAGGLFILFHYQKSQQKTQLSQQLPLFLRALGSTLKAGYSVPQALTFVAGEVEDPLRSKLQRGVRLLEWQQPLENVLNDWRKSVGVPEFSFLARSLIMQSKTGGNLVDLCHRVANLLEEREKLERDIRSFTAQGKMSGVLMAGLWPVSLLLFAWLSPSHTQVLFTTLPGQILLGLSFSLELIGFYFIWRLIRLKI